MLVEGMVCFPVLRLCFNRIQDLQSTVQNGRVFQMYDAAAWPWFAMPLHDLSVLKIVGAKIVTNGLFVYVKVSGNLGDASRGQGMLDAA